MRLLFLSLCFHSLMTNSSSSDQPLCHDDEGLALLQFNQSLSLDKDASGDPSAYPKTASWQLKQGSDCCSWDGVECDDNTGHVIGLDLGSSFLYGSINSSSSLFRLLHLQKLNLADNNFNYSQIPSRISHLSRLTYLNLSASLFSGQIPLKISKLSKLTSLDLSLNSDSSVECLLKLEKSDLNRLLRNLSDLKELNLCYVNISSRVPDVLANFSSLTSLLLKNCELYGEFPIAIFQLPNLQALNVKLNPHLTGYFPEFNKSSRLKLLKVATTGFSGELPNSIGNLNYLQMLDIHGCNFSGSSIQSSLGNLTAQLTTLDFSSIDLSNFSRRILAWVGKQTKLTFLGLANSSLIGEIPSSLRNLTQLDELHLYSNQLTGQIPSWLANLTKLTQLTLDSNQLHGPIPQSIFELQNLELLHLNLNHLSGTVEFDMFLNLKNLVSLQLSHNNLSLLTTTSVNATLRKFKLLGLAACNLSEFPDFLQHQDELEFLELSRNRIQGQIPKWIWNIGIETLTYMSVSYNFLTGFDHPPVVLPWTTLQVLNLESNMLQGSLLIPPPSTLFYLVSNNSLAGDLSPLICSLTSLYVLDLSNNNLRGELPKCLGNFSDSLLVLNLRKNNFHGTIPQTYTNGSKLKMIDLSQNRLHGWIPRSLANCKMLEILNLGNNQMSDTFPFWLGKFQELRVLIMRSNAFHGAIKSFDIKFGFPKLRIIDLSCNMFSGKLPFEYFKNWNAMKIANADHLTYLQTGKGFGSLYYSWDENYKYSMTITNKGAETIYTSIPEIFTAIDLSSNSFEGGIPESIGDLKGLQLLNFSNNILTGCLPSCIGNLTNLESLDLSQNMLSGELPQQLTELTFLAFLNISHNHLTGPIPQGEQFDTFENTSFEGNSGLCGKPLSKKCGNSEASLPPSLTTEQDEDFKFPRGYDWIFILTGYGSGLVVGLVIGRTVTTRKHEWFVETFGRRPRKKKRVKRDARPASGKLNVTTSSCNAIEATLELNGSGVGSSKNINKFIPSPSLLLNSNKASMIKL